MNGILYSSLGGRFRKYHGSIDDKAQGCLTNFWISDPQPRNCKMRFLVNKNPGVLYNKQVWFEQENEEEALKLLMEREDSEIANLYKEIARHSSIYADLKLRLINIRKNGTEE